MALSLKSNPYYFTFITSVFITIISHLIKNLDEILEINCGGFCLINSFNELGRRLQLYEENMCTSTLK